MNMKQNLLITLQVLTLALQLALGFVAWGRLDGRLTALESNVKILLEVELNRSSNHNPARNQNQDPK